MECENGQLKNIDDVVTKELSNDIKKKHSSVKQINDSVTVCRFNQLWKPYLMVNGKITTKTESWGSFKFHTLAVFWFLEKYQ
jgi:hypothetical protein